MAVALTDAAVGDYEEGAGTTVTFNFTTTAGTDFLVFRPCSWGKTGFSGATFNGDAATTVLHRTSGGGSAGVCYLIAPDIGTYSVVMTFTGAGYGGCFGDVQGFSGVKQTSPVDDSDEQDYNCGGISRTLTVSAADGLLIGAWSDAHTMTSTNGQTQNATGNGYYKLGLSAGSFTDTFSLASGCGNARMVDVVFLAATGGGGSTQPPRSMHQFGMRRNLRNDDRDARLFLESQKKTFRPSDRLAQKYLKEREDMRRAA